MNWRPLRPRCFVYPQRFFCPRIPASATPLASRTGWWHLPLGFTIAIIIETIAIELALPWAWLRLTLFIASIYCLIAFWIVNIERILYPSYIHDHLVLRRGRAVIASIPRDAIAQIRQDRHFHASEYEIKNQTLLLGGPNGTNIHIRLNRTLTIQCPRLPWQPRTQTSIDEIRLWADQPDSLSALQPPPC